MIGYLFENRNSKLKTAMQIADHLGRSLRENVQFFSFENDGEASFISESGYVISGRIVSNSDTLVFENLQVQSSEMFSSDDEFNKVVSSKIKGFLSNINESDYSQADDSFDNIINLWETRLHFNEVSTRLNEKREIFNEGNSILENVEFQRFLEIAPQVVNWLKENKEEISAIPEIKNAVKLSNSVANAFDIPKMSIEEMSEKQSLEFSKGTAKNLYEMICRQELVNKELMESKKGFDSIWATNKQINELAGAVYSSDEKEITNALLNAIEDVPYLALATKKQLKECLYNSLQVFGVNEMMPSDERMKDFVSQIFEMKKPIKKLLIDTINEKYGINVQNLKAPTSFRSLIETQIVIFESLSKLSPKASVMKDVLGKVSKMLKEKTGVESIDVNDILQAIFEKAGYEDLCDIYSLTESVSMKDVFDHDLTSEEIISLMEASKKKKKKSKSCGVAHYSDLDDKEGEGGEGGEGGSVGEATETDEDDEKKEKKKKKLSKKQSEEMDKDDDGDIDGDDLKKLRNEAEEKPVKTKDEDEEEDDDEEKEDKKDKKGKKKSKEEDEVESSQYDEATEVGDKEEEASEEEELSEEESEGDGTISKEDFFETLSKLEDLLGAGGEDSDPSEK